MPTPEEYAQWAEYENWTKYQASKAQAQPAPQEVPGVWNTLGAAAKGVYNVGAGLVGQARQVISDEMDPTIPGLPFGMNYGMAAGDRAIQHPETIAHGAAGIGAGVIGAFASPLAGGLSYPLLNQGANYLNQFLGLEKPQTPMEQYKGLISDTTGGLFSTALPGIVKTAAVKAPAFIRGALDADNPAATYMEDPSVQAGARIAYNKNQGIFGGATPEEATLNPTTMNALEAQQSVADMGMTNAVGLQLGTAADRTIGIRGATETFESKVEPIINDPAIVSATSIPELAQVAQDKLQSAAQARNTFAQTLDAQGHTVMPDAFNPILQEMQQQATKLAEAKQTAPFAQAIIQEMNDFSNFIQNKAGSTGWTPSRLMTMSEDYNLYRRQLGEFNRRVQGTIAQGDIPTAIGKEIADTFLPKIQAHINSILDGLADPSGKSTPFSNLQKEFGGWAALHQQALDQAYNTKTGLTQEPPRNVVKNSGNAPGQSAYDPTRSLKANVGTAFSNWWDRLVGNSSPESMKMLSDAQRDTTIMSNIKDFYELGKNPIDIQAGRNLENHSQLGYRMGRGSAAAQSVPDMDLLNKVLTGVSQVPLIRRDWDLVKKDPNAMNAVAQMAQAMGLILAPDFAFASEPVQKEIHKTVIQMNPQGAERVPGGYNIINGEYMNPLERDADVKQALDLPPVERAKRVGLSWQNKYAPRSETPVQPQQPLPKASSFDIADLNNNLESALSTPSFDASYNGETSAIISELERATNRHLMDELN